MGLFQVSEQVHGGCPIATIKCPNRLDQVAGQELLELCPEWIRKPAKLYAFDFSNVDALIEAIKATNALEQSRAQFKLTMTDNSPLS